MIGKGIIAILTVLLGVLILLVAYSQFVFWGYALKVNKGDENAPRTIWELVKINPYKSIGVGTGFVIGITCVICGVAMANKIIKSEKK